MIFVNTEFFWAMLLPLMVFIFLISTNKSKVSRVFDPKVLERLRASEESMPMGLRNGLLFVSLILMIVALARPVIEKGEQKVEVQGLSMLVALDISDSMRSKDVYPNRLEFAKKKMVSLFDAMPSDEIGVVAFAYSPFVLAPFSSDKETLKTMIEGVDDSYINMGTTDFSALAEQVSVLLDKKTPKILVLFSDGGDKEAIANFSEILKTAKIDLYVVFVGTEEGAPVLDKMNKPLKLPNGTIAITQRNDALGEVAKECNGAYVIAANGKEDISELVSVMRGKYKNQQQGEVTVSQKEEYFYIPLGLALIFLLLGLSSLPSPRNQRNNKEQS